MSKIKKAFVLACKDLWVIIKLAILFLIGTASAIYLPIPLFFAVMVGLTLTVCFVIHYNSLGDLDER